MATIEQLEERIKTLEFLLLQALDAVSETGLTHQLFEDIVNDDANLSDEKCAIVEAAYVRLEQQVISS